MSNIYIIGVFLLSIVYLLVTIIKFKMNPFFSMLSASILVGVAVGLPLVDIVNAITSGFGGILGALGMVIGLGALLGAFLNESGAIEQLAQGVLKISGKKHASLAMNIIGYIVSIPVFMGSAYVILNPLCKSISKDTQKNVIVYSTALCVGLTVTHCMVIPTPGPLAVSTALGANVGWFIFYAIIVSIPAALVGGWLYGEFLGKKYPYEETTDDTVQEQSVAKKNAPSSALSFAVILLPIVLILLGTVVPMLVPSKSVAAVFGFLTAGSGLIALLISVIFAMVVMRKYIDVPYAKIVSKTFNEQGEMFMILGAGGAFGGIIKASNIGDCLVEMLSGMNISVVVLAFILCLFLRAALGSATVAMLTSATVLGPVASQMGVNMVLLGLAICAAAVGMTIPTDGGFWLYEKLDNFGIKKAFQGCTGGVTIASFVAFAIVVLLSTFAGVLPGLH